MNLSRDFECQSTESQEELLHISCMESAQQLSEVPSVNDSCQCLGTCILSRKDEKGMNNSVWPNEALLLDEWLSNFHDRDYIEEIKQFHLYVDKVKKITRPGCSPETLSVALSSMSTVFETLSTISSKQYMHSSL